MNLVEYQKNAQRTLPDLGTLQLNLCHMALGLTSEVGELVNCIGTELKMKVDIPNLKEEIGDMYWYITNYCTVRNVPLPIEIKHNVPQDRCFELLLSSSSQIADIVKKFMAYSKDIQIPAEYEAVYDVFSSLELLASIYNLDGDEIRERNINKLKVRYPQKFSNEAAINRDLDAERKTLE